MQLLPGILMLTKLIGREGKLLNVGIDRTLCIYKWPLSFDRKLFSHNKDKALHWFWLHSATARTMLLQCRPLDSKTMMDAHEAADEEEHIII